nr:hypothetical protein CFP56_03683 [Quercus suber]
MPARCYAHDNLAVLRVMKSKTDQDFTSDHMIESQENMPYSPPGMRGSAAPLSVNYHSPSAPYTCNLIDLAAFRLIVQKPDTHIRDAVRRRFLVTMLSHRDYRISRVTRRFHVKMASWKRSKKEDYAFDREPYLLDAVPFIVATGFRSLGHLTSFR